MKTNKKILFLKCFSQEEIKRFPIGCITKSEIAKHVLQDISSKDDDDNLMSKIILIKPNIWGPEYSIRRISVEFFLYCNIDTFLNQYSIPY